MPNANALFCAALIALVTTTASAADLALKAPAAPPIKFTWTGCYVGGHVGGTVSDDRLGTRVNYDGDGFVGGGQIGCDYQFAPNWVIGAEGRAAWSSMRSTHAAFILNPFTGVLTPTQFITTNDFLASATARFGYVYAERWLVYARGGVGWTRERDELPQTLPTGVAVDPSATSVRTGWTVGGGVEWAFAPHWSANVEYNYYDFGTQSMTMTNAVPLVAVIGTVVRDQIHAATAGVNYRF
ncbi:membrane protein [Bradyrhizobium sp. LTSP885]|uniref:outer membrane protein n=1 Tax=Bradyrhizobium sp. LTSP885 TaxID=1619232 RepID=UPI0005CB7BFB|nr:outer membrane protein [Bradyrhizobium sp. LTSP885]KJC46795.1 membrane protein [Bradyrhizobium sp. LTSP885]